jgi:hypothetical protein
MMNTVSSPVKRSGFFRALQIISRVLVILAIGFAAGWILHRIESSFEKSPKPAGFVRGVVQGALMPMAMPNLLVGNDVAIYAVNNTGRSYRLGYTVGVNACGLIFFGIFFWRLRRLRKLSSGQGEQSAR